ncbi:MAG: lactate utilization protein [Clostridia bacterium]
MEKLLQNLTRKGFKPFYFENKSQAVEKILQLIPIGSSVGFGGSMTVKELELDKQLHDNGRIVYNSTYTPTELKSRQYQLAQTADYFVSSTNALTKDGDFVNIDGTANRVSSLIFGAKTVIYVLGENKICHDLDSAIYRIRNYVAPLNAQRLNRDTPCKTSGQCCLCDSPDCMCNTTVISHHPTKYQENVYVIIIRGSYGY